MTVNGEKNVAVKEMTLTQFLEQKGYVKSRVAVELNGNIVKKTEYDNTILSDADTLEIVSFVGGG